MIKIRLVGTSPRLDGQFDQIWEVNGVEYETTSEWGEIQFHDSDDALFDKVTVNHVITLAIHGHGPTSDGEEIEWAKEDLVKTLQDGSYL